jgi:hypothetical protein
LDIRHHSGNHVIPSENRLIHLPYQFIGEFRELSKEFAVDKSRQHITAMAAVIC